MTRNAIQMVTAMMVLLGRPALAGPPDRVPPPKDVHFRSASGDLQPGVRCAAPQVSREDKDRVDAALRAFRGGRGNRAPKPEPMAAPEYERGENGEIPVVFHVVYKVTKRGSEGYVDRSQLEEQIDVLNDAYREHGFTFYLADVDWTNNSKWFSGCYSYSTEYAMKRALAVDPAHVLNIYTCKPKNEILGYAYYPWSFPETSVWNGVVALYSSLPGGSAAPYNEGDTVTHETGHYLGLYHTFEGGCALPGDSVSDTPAEAIPDYDCEETRDSCPADPGSDPVRNFMDYGDDQCIDHFTDGQATRMMESVTVYRPHL